MVKYSKILINSVLLAGFIIGNLNVSFAEEPACVSTVKKLKTDLRKAETNNSKAQRALSRAYGKEFSTFVTGERQLLRPRMREETNKLAANIFTVQCALMWLGGESVCKLVNPDYATVRDPRFNFKKPLRDEFSLDNNGEKQYKESIANYDENKTTQEDLLKKARTKYNQEVCVEGRDDCLRKVALFQTRAALNTQERRTIQKTVERTLDLQVKARERALKLADKAEATLASKQDIYDQKSAACDAEVYIQECKDNFIKSCRRDVNTSCAPLSSKERASCKTAGYKKCSDDAAVTCKG